MKMDENKKEQNLYALREIISEAEAAINNINDDEIDEVQQNFMRIKFQVEDLRF